MRGHRKKAEQLWLESQPKQTIGPDSAIYKVGGNISAPRAIDAPEAEFSEEARRAKYQGDCEISLIVDTEGNPKDVRVIRSLGMGLDEKALAAVRKYRFKPALKEGQTPVAVMIKVTVSFML